MSSDNPNASSSLSDEDREILAYMRLQRARKEASRFQIAKCVDRQDYPLSSAQLRLWFLDQIEPGNPAYHYCFRLRFGGPFDIDALRAALSEIMRRHDVLRARFIVRDLELVQSIRPPTAVDLPFVDAQSFDEQSRQSELAERIFHLNQDSFDLADDLLVRSLLVKLDEQDHLLLICLHHIVTDRWSMDVFVRELESLYRAYLNDTASALDELPIQYTDYAVWEREQHEGDAYKKSLEYWRSQLAELPTLAMPTDRPRPKTRDFGSAKAVHWLPSDLTDKLRQLAKAEGITLFVVYLTGFAVLLQRLADQEDVAIGSPVTNRNLPELESLIGYFLNTLVLRIDLSGDPSVGVLLHRVRDMLLDAYRHQDVPFETLVEKLAPKRDLSLSPLFQVLFVHLGEMTVDAPAPAQASANAQSQSGNAPYSKPVLSQPDKVSTDYDLEAYITDETEQAIVTLHFRTDIFDQATIERMIDQYEQVLGAMAADSAQKIGRISLLSAAQSSRMLALGQGPKMTLPELCTHRLFEQNAQRTPEAIAVEAGERFLSYRELNERANQLARRLRELGVGPGSLVGVCMDRSVELMIGVLGVMKSGGAYVPLDTEFPPERLAFMVEDAQLAVVVTRNALAQEKLPQTGAVLLDLELDRSALESLDSDNLDGGALPGDLVYVIYTSGSTGRPKGVCIEHHSLANFAISTAKLLALGTDDRLLGVASLSFDASVLDLYVPLVCGARVVLVDRETAADPILLAELITHTGASLMHATPATWQLLRSAGWEGAANLQALSGGEALPWPLANWLVTRCRALVNLYGPTEATVYVATEVVSADVGGEGVVGIGASLANTHIHVLDDALRPVPPGVPGELCIGGAQVARGYLNREELTARQFVIDPFAAPTADPIPRTGGAQVSRSPEARLYRTGDLARYRADGSIEFIGRADDQVKVRGFRVELGEVESVLAEDAAVAQTVVMCREDVPGDQRLVAYVVARDVDGADTQAFTQRLRERARAKLPTYMVPAAVIVLDALPLTPNRKVDRAALPAPRDVAGPDVVGADEATTEVEKMLSDVWREALGVTRVGVRDNFFDLGGHSLLVIQVIGVMRKKTGIAMPAREYMMQNLRQIAGLYDRAGALRKR